MINRPFWTEKIVRPWKTRSIYPREENWVIAPHDGKGFSRRVRRLTVRFAGISQIFARP